MKIFIALILVVIFIYIKNLIFKNKTFGLLGNIVVGIVGCFVGILIGEVFGFNIGLHVILSGILGAIVILFLFNRLFTLLR